MSEKMKKILHTHTHRHACPFAHCQSTRVCVTCTIYAAFAVDSFGALWRRRRRWRRWRWRWRPFAACPYTHFKLFIFTLCCNTCTHTHARLSRSLRLSLSLFTTLGRQRVVPRPTPSRKEQRTALYICTTWPSLTPPPHPFLTLAISVSLSGQLAFLFRTCKLFAFCLIPYTHAHKLS